jgi:hypothetical protein
MYLQQKDVESACLAWIQTACMFMIGEVCARTAISLQDERDVIAVLEGQKDEWKPVCLPPLTTCRTLFRSLLVPTGPQGRVGHFILPCLRVLFGIESDALSKNLQRSCLLVLDRVCATCASCSMCRDDQTYLTYIYVILLYHVYIRVVWKVQVFAVYGPNMALHATHAI